MNSSLNASDHPSTLRAKNRISVWLLPAEKKALQSAADSHSLSASAYLRAVGLGHPIKSTIDQAAILELSKIRGDQGRLGGLLKMWLSNEERVANPERLKALVEKIEELQTVLTQKIQNLAAKP